MRVWGSEYSGFRVVSIGGLGFRTPRVQGLGSLGMERNMGTTMFLSTEDYMLHAD